MFRGNPNPPYFVISIFIWPTSSVTRHNLQKFFTLSWKFSFQWDLNKAVVNQQWWRYCLSSPVGIKNSNLYRYAGRGTALFTSIEKFLFHQKFSWSFRFYPIYTEWVYIVLYYYIILYTLSECIVYYTLMKPLVTNLQLLCSSPLRWW